jgi:GNAT superfamily N-acetyltransferase
MADMLEHYLPDPIIPPGASMQVEELDDPREIRRFLLRDRGAHAYLLGYLEPAYFQWCRWYGARRSSGEIGSLVCLYLGLSIPIVFIVGASEDFEPFLRRCGDLLPRPFHFHVLDHQMDAVERVFSLGDYKRMLRLGLERDTYVGFGVDTRTERLGHRDTASIMALYEHYPDHFFEPHQLESGLYFGVRDEESEHLISIAGIHVVSDELDVAVIGNILTHPDFRGRGLGRACVSRLLDDVFDRVSYVALNVQSDNAPAIHIFERFGFQENNVFFEGRCLGED